MIDLRARSGLTADRVTMVDVRPRSTRRQLETLIAYIEAGSIAAAAHELGISETTARQHLSGLHRRTGCLNAAQAAYGLGAREWRPWRPTGVAGPRA